MLTLRDAEQRAVAANVTAALAEDVGSGDLTAALIDPDTIIGATVIAREALVLCGRPWADEVFHQVDETIHVDWYVLDGQAADADDVICKLVGPARGLLTAERTALNFLQTLSATATVTARFVAAVEGTGARVLDTRKTLPGLRQAQKYAVRCGGGENHRSGLFDAVLIKENHIRSCGGIAAAVRSAQQRYTDVLIEVEVETLDELGEALGAGAARILLDNFTLEQLREAVAVNRGFGYVAAELEASGNVTLETIRDIAVTGVDFISTGALTKNVAAIDLSMQFRID